MRWLILPLLLVGVPVMAEESPPVSDAALRKLAETSQQRANALLKTLPPTQQPQDKARQLFGDAARSLNQRHVQHLRKSLPAPKRRDEHPRFVLFASESLGDETLKSLFRQASNYPDWLIVFRGLKPGDTLKDYIGRLHHRMKGLNPPPNVTLNPNRFRKLAVDAVPFVAAYNNQGKLQATVKGTYSIDWIQDKLDTGDTGDLGVYGNLYAIVEIDMIEMMQNRVANIDWKKKKAAAIQRFWERQSFIDLPRAPRDRTRHIDPTVTAREDIRDAEGRLIAQRGQRFNPFSVMPFNQTLIVFDATDPEQIDTVYQLSRKTRNRTVLLASILPRQDGWKHYQKLEKRMGRPIKKLTPEIRQRFYVEAVPSVITADREKFIVREIGRGNKS